MSTISTCSVSPQLSMIPQDKDSGRQKPYVNAYDPDPPLFKGRE